VRAAGWRGAGAVVFGGSGFLGTHLLRLYPEMISAGRTRPEAPNRHIHLPGFENLAPLDTEEFDRVLFCVGTSRHYELMRGSLETALDAHLLPFIRLAEYLRPRPLQCFVRLSTALLAAPGAVMPIDEESPIDPWRDRYLMSQYIGEQAAAFLGGEVPIATLRLTNTYGPWPGLRTDLIHQIVVQLRDTGRAEIASRDPERDFVFVEDAAHAMASLAEANQKGLFLLGSGESHSAGIVADLLQGISGMTVTSRQEPVQGLSRILINSAKLRRTTGWEPQTSLADGLRRTWEAMHAPGD
jgi:nucleoside-diphosphate-sugar epimerase